MENIWGHVAPDFTEGWFGGRLVPTVDLSENPTSVEVRMDLPGLKPEDIDIQLANNVLTISGERKAEKEEKGKTYHRVERRRGTFSRSLTLPTAVAEDKVDAEYREGVLTVTLQKTDEAKSRKIKVKS
jgi:HSP20 family protein